MSNQDYPMNIIQAVEWLEKNPGKTVERDDGSKYALDEERQTFRNGLQARALRCIDDVAILVVSDRVVHARFRPVPETRRTKGSK